MRIITIIALFIFPSLICAQIKENLLFTNYFNSNVAAGLKKTVKSKSPSGYTKKNVFWYFPNQVEQINGLSIGLWAENLKNDGTNERDSLELNGLSIEVNPIMLFILIRGVWHREYPDSIEYYNSSVKNYYSTTKNGISLSLLGSVGSEQINGINIGGINTVVDKICGVSITGLNSFAYISKGFSFALIRNRSTLTKGFQIGLFNKTTDLRGIQIGLWNKNGKRSLPLINWQFKAKA